MSTIVYVYVIRGYGLSSTYAVVLIDHKYSICLCALEPDRVFFPPRVVDSCRVDLDQEVEGAGAGAGAGMREGRWGAVHTTSQTC